MKVKPGYVHQLGVSWAGNTDNPMHAVPGAELNAASF